MDLVGLNIQPTVCCLMLKGTKRKRESRTETSERKRKTGQIGTNTEREGRETKEKASRNRVTNIFI